MKITLDGKRLYVPGERVRVKDAPDVEVTVIGTQVYSAHATYDCQWWHDGTLKRETFKDWQVERASAPRQMGFARRRGDQI